MATLTIGNRFPDLAGDVVGDGRRRLPSELHHRYTVLLFYRGHW